MFKFRLVLLFVGVYAVILGTESYTYPSTSGYSQQSQQTNNEGYSGSYSSTPGYSQQSQQTNNEGYSGSYSSTPGYSQQSQQTNNEGYGYSGSYPSTPGYSQQYQQTNNEGYGYSGYGYGASSTYPSVPSYSAPNSYGYSGYYAKGCSYNKVIEVLDQIFCQHVNKKRYSSTIYPIIDTIIEQLEWTYELIFIQDVYDYVIASIHELKTLQDAVYNIYYDSSLLESYKEDKLEEGQTPGAGTNGASTTGGNARTDAANKLIKARQQLVTFETMSKQFKKRQGVNFQKSQSQKINEQEKVVTIEIDVTETDGNQRSERDGLEVVVEEADKRPKLFLKKPNERLLSKARASRGAYLGKRKIRGTDYSDYTCSYLSPLYCSEDKYDELLYNILDSIYTALNFLWEALDETADFIDQIDCKDKEDKEALEEASIYFGAILTSFYTLIEVAVDVERMFEIMDLDYGDASGSYYRAGGGSGNSYYSSSQPQSSIYSSDSNIVPPYNSQPQSMPFYPYSGYIAQPASYSLPQQYRYQRNAVSHGFPHVYLVG